MMREQRPSHPPVRALLLMLVVALAVIILAAITTFDTP